MDEDTVITITIKENPQELTAEQLLEKIKEVCLDAGVFVTTEVEN